MTQPFPGRHINLSSSVDFLPILGALPHHIFCTTIDPSHPPFLEARTLGFLVGRTHNEHPRVDMLCGFRKLSMEVSHLQ